MKIHHLVLTIIVSLLLSACAFQAPSERSNTAFSKKTELSALDKYMNNHEAAMRNALNNSGITIVRNYKTLDVILPGDVTFATNSVDVKSRATPMLKNVAHVINEFDNTKIVVEGHTDNGGSEQYNLGLSERRADSIKALLVKLGVDSTRITTLGMGEYQPIASNDDTSGKQKNRRVEITIHAIENDL